MLCYILLFICKLGFSKYRALAFLFGLAYALEYIFRLHLGNPYRRIGTTEMGSVASGGLLVRFSIDLGRLLRYLEQRREETGVEITITHLAVKGAALAISEIANLNGHVINGDFYKSRTKGVDIGVSMELFENETVVVKVSEADFKPVDYIADELLNRIKDLRDGSDPSHSRKARFIG